VCGVVVCGVFVCVCACVRVWCVCVRVYRFFSLRVRSTDSRIYTVNLTVLEVTG